MSRRIVTQVFQRGDSTSKVDTYFDKLIKYIPADIVVAWITAKGLISTASDVPKQNILWIAFGVGVILTFLWTLKQTYVKGQKLAFTQTVLSTIAFVIWVIATGVPFTMNPLYGSLLLIFYTLVIALINPKES